MENPSKRFDCRDEGDIIYLDVDRNGMTAEEWLNYFEVNNIPVHGYFKYCLRSKFFVPGEIGTTIHLVIMKRERPGATTVQVREEAANRSFVATSIEAACLILLNLNQGDLEFLGLERIAVMHEPVSYPNEGFDLFLGIRTDHVFTGNFYINSPTFIWDHKTGHAYELP